VRFYILASDITRFACSDINNVLHTPGNRVRFGFGCIMRTVLGPAAAVPIAGALPAAAHLGAAAAAPALGGVAGVANADGTVNTRRWWARAVVSLYCWATSIAPIWLAHLSMTIHTWVHAT
jgi:hypothetical protein